MNDVLAWVLRTTAIPNGGFDGKRDATDDERSAVAKMLGLLALRRLAATYRIVAMAGGGYRLSGTVASDLDQACVVTLEPVAARATSRFEVEFWPKIGNADNDEDASVLAGPDVELLDNGVIPVGRIVFETLSSSLDPYPRVEGAEFRWQDPRASAAEKDNPFAALSRFKGDD